MEPFGSFPAVLGHEVLARVAEVGSEVRTVEVGQRVVVDPMIPCSARGYEEGNHCRSCTAGLHSTCERAGDEGLPRHDGSRLGRGLTIGYHADLPGGWGESMVAHESQLFPVPDAVPDLRAVLTEPVSIGVHGALRSPPHADEPVLVIGSGPIALGTIWALPPVEYKGRTQRVGVSYPGPRRIGGASLPTRFVGIRGPAPVGGGGTDEPQREVGKNDRKNHDPYTCSESE